MSNNMFGRNSQSAYGSNYNSTNYSNNYSSGTYGNNSSSNNNNNSYSNYRQNNSNNNRSKIGTYRVANYDPDKLNEPSLSRTQQYK